MVDNQKRVELEQFIDNLHIDSEKEKDRIADEYIHHVRQPVIAEAFRFTKERNTIILPAFVNSFVLIFVRLGTVEIAVNTQVANVVAGFAVGVTSNTETKITAKGDSVNEVEILMFDIATVFSYGMTILAVKYGAPFINLERQGFETFSATNGIGAEINKNMKAIQKYMAERPYAYELMVKARLCEIWYMIVNAMTKVVELKEAYNPRRDEIRVKAALEFIELHYMEPLTLEDIANEINICKSECCRCFKRILDVTPIEAVVRYRIYKAAYFLDESGRNKDDIASIAIKVGFNNTSYFNKMFKKYIGGTPTEYRNRQRGDMKAGLNGGNIIL